MHHHGQQCVPNSCSTSPQRTGDTKPNFFQDCLMEVFDSLEQHIQNPVVLESILSLMDRGTMVLTTNYDNLLEIFGQQQSKPMESLDLKDKTKVRAKCAGGSGRSLLWAHSHSLRQPGSCPEPCPLPPLAMLPAAHSFHALSYSTSGSCLY